MQRPCGGVLAAPSPQSCVLTRAVVCPSQRLGARIGVVSLGGRKEGAEAPQEDLAGKILILRCGREEAEADLSCSSQGRPVGIFLLGTDSYTYSLKKPFLFFLCFRLRVWSDTWFRLQGCSDCLHRTLTQPCVNSCFMHNDKIVISLLFFTQSKDIKLAEKKSLRLWWGCSHRAYRTHEHEVGSNAPGQ